MPFFVNPFSKNDLSEYPGVLIPLADAHQTPSGDDKKDDSSSVEERGTAHVGDNTSLTLEILIAEVESDVAASGHDSAYDRTSMELSCALG
jgi:hypothetical protein